jgi:hypothetical protein
LALASTASRAADLDLALTIEPATGRASVMAVIEAPAESFTLAPELKAEGLTLDGRSVRPDATGHVALPVGRYPEIRYSFALPRLDAASDIGFIEPQGSLLLGSGWFPDWGEESFSYEVRLDVPAPQRAIAPGRLMEESVSAGRYAAHYQFDRPARDITIVAGPLEIGETMRDRLRLRTYFPAALASLGQKFRDRTGAYLARYSALIGPYPHDGFSVVAGPAPVGFGFPTFTLLSSQILALPFVLDRSLGHEVLHGWWGNGVAVDYQHGNWSEALTVFMADYAFAEEDSNEAAREMRRRWLADFAGLPADQDTPVAEFRSKGAEATQIVGYNKGAMVFVMLRDEIGAPAFTQALRNFWRDFQFRRAGWDDLRAAFEAASGSDLRPFFAQWIARAGAPVLALESAERQKEGVALTLRQDGTPYALRLPVRLATASGSETRTIALDGARQTIFLASSEPVTELAIDPDYRVFRRLAPSEVAPTIRRMIVAERTAPVAAGPRTSNELATRAAKQIVERPGAVTALATAVAAHRPILLVGLAGEIAPALDGAGLPTRPDAVPSVGSGQLWAARYAGEVPLLVLEARDEAALAAMLPAIRHYGGESFLAFEGARVIAHGVLPPKASPLVARFER